MHKSLRLCEIVPAIELTAISKTFVTTSGEFVHALDNTSLAINPGEFITVVGASGCGKTTLLRLIAGLERCTSGTIAIKGARQVGPSEQAGIVFQDPTLLPWRTVLQNVLLPVEVLRLDARTYGSRAKALLEANWKLWYENYNDSLHVPFVHPGSLAKQRVKSRQRASHVETDGSYIAHFTVHGGSRGLLEENQDMALPRFPNLTGRYAEGTYYPCLLPATLFGFTIDCVWVFELYPKGPDRTTLAATSLFSTDQVALPDFAEKAEYYYRRVDTIVPEDNEAVERQQEGLCLPVGLSGKFTHMETLCHAFDNWVLDQMVDG